MIRLTFAQMRRSIGRLSAAGIAIAIGTAFIVVTLLAGSVITRTTYDAISAQFGKADLVVTGFDTLAEDDAGVPLGGVPLTPEQIDTVENTDAVAAVLPQEQRFTTIVGGGSSDHQLFIPVSENDKLNPLEIADGRLPSDSGEVALAADFAGRLGLGTGDTVSAEFMIYPSPDDDFAELEEGAGPAKGAEDAQDLESAEDTPEPILDEPEVTTVPLTVVGLVNDPNGAFAMFGGAGVATLPELKNWAELEQVTDSATQLAVALEADASAKGAVATIEAALDDSGVKVQTRDDAAADTAKAFTGGEDILTNVVLAFAGLALLVAGLVIANTFQVLVAQRTRTLALLRCVGANKRQLRQSVLIEAGVLGLGASLVGILLGTGVGQLALTVLGRFDMQVPLPSMITMTPAVWIVPILAGVAVTTIAALAPARAATRVSPLAAMRPAEAPTIRSGGRLRLMFALLFTLGGFGLLGLGLALAKAERPTLGLALGLLGGALSFIGVIVGAVFWIPGVTRLVGRIVSKAGPSGKLAVANTVRNPGRTAATSTALLIGVTLVVMMSTGAISARQTLNQGLDEQYPVDAWATSDTWNANFGPDSGSEGVEPAGEAFTPALRSQVEAIEGVTATMPILSTHADIDPGYAWQVFGIDPAEAAEVARDANVLDGLTDDTVLLNRGMATELGILEGDQVTVTAPSADQGASQVEPTSISLEAVFTTQQFEAPVVTRTNMATMSPEAQISDLWISLDPEADAYAAVEEVQEAFADTPTWVRGAAVERAMFQQIIDTLLAIVVGLLAVAVVIALIGVANTLSLSVIERQRENAMLRAVGLSRKQLRRTLAIEGILIATVGTGLGVLLGLIYGWVGSLTVLTGMGDVALAVPWRDLGIVLVVALIAGLLASVIPARRAVRTSPVEALAVE